MNKKLISTGLAAALTLTLIAPVSAFYDVEPGTVYSESIALLSDLGIISGRGDGSFDPDAPVSRAEFAKIAVEAADLSPDYGGSLFPDVPQDNWAAGYVNAAAKAGLITGLPGGYFAPNDSITYAQAITVALRLLGYNSGSIGGKYPDAYIAKASALKLDEGLTYSKDAVISRRDTALIIANTMTADTLAGGKLLENQDYSISDECVVLADYRNSGDEILTTAGTYRFDGDKELYIGKKVKLITDKDNRLIGIISVGNQPYHGVIASADQGSVTLIDDGRLEKQAFSSSTLVYWQGSETDYGNARSQFCPGDEIYYVTSGDNVVYATVKANDDSQPQTAGETDLSGYVVVSGGKTVQAVPTDIVCVYPEEQGAIVYRDKVTGVLTSASPSRENADTVTVSGVDYSVKGSLVKEQVKELAINDTVTVILGRGGSAAAVYKNSAVGNVYGISSVFGNEIICNAGDAGMTLNMENSSRVFFQGKDTSWEKVKQSVSSGMTISVYYDERGLYDYSVIEENELSLPVIASSDRENPFGNTSVVRNSKRASEADIKKYDVVYYSSALNTAYAYSDTLSGVYEKAYPDQQNPSSVKISGKVYSIETSAAASALSDIGYDTYVTLLLGRDGKIAGVKPVNDSGDVSEYGVVLSCEKKAVDGTSDYYVRMLSAGGSEQEFKSKTDYSKYAGEGAQLSFEGGYVTLKFLKNNGLAGAVSLSDNKIGSYSLSADCKIADVTYVTDSNTAVAAMAELSDIMGMKLSKSSVKGYVTNTEGEIIYIVLDNATSVNYKFGIIAENNGSSTLGYSLDLGGVEKTYSSDSNIKAGKGTPVMVQIVNSRIVNMRQLTCTVSGEGFVSISAGRVVTKGGSYDLAKNVAIYIRTDINEYRLTSVDDCDDFDIVSASVYSETSGGAGRIVILD